MICEGCKKEVKDSPFVEKKWSELDEKETWHTKCFVIWHATHLGYSSFDILRMIKEEKLG